jgi:hypothetical protein
LVPARVAAASLLVVHLALAPLALVYRAAYPFGPPHMSKPFYLPATMPDEVKDQDLIVVNPPSPLHAGYFLVMGELEGRVLPRHLRCLATGLTPMTVYRQDERTIVIRPRHGFMPWLLDRLVRNERHPMSVGDRVELTGMTTQVLSINAEGQPTAAEFCFDVPLEHPSLRWLCWREGQFEPFVPPPVGEETTLALPPRGRLLTGDYQP